MPSAKNNKSSTTYVHHTPTNRAFALRMMNSAQNTEGRMSPLDRALKPFKEGFKKSSKTKRAKDKDNQSPTPSSHSNNDSRDEESLYTTFEPESEAQHRWNSSPSPPKNVFHENNRNGRLKDYPSEKMAQSAIKLGIQYNEMMHGTYRAMEDISEEDEFNNYGREDNYVGVQELRRHRRHKNVMNGNSSSAAQLQDYQLMERELKQSKHFTEGDLTEPLDKNQYFVAPNGEIVRLRRKKQEEMNGDDKMKQTNAIRAERFGKRLSLLCHMLAEKYPEDFHILELLVELQVSNEKREEEMNKSVKLLGQKMESMEQRLAVLEQQSPFGFQQILSPLAAAAEAFSIGINHSLSNVIQHNQEKSKDNSVPSDSIKQSEEDSRLSLNSTNGKKELIDGASSLGVNDQNENCDESHDELDSSKVLISDNMASGSQADDSTCKRPNISDEVKEEVSSPTLEEIQVELEIGEDSFEIEPTIPDEGESYSYEDSPKYATENNNGNEVSLLPITNKFDEKESKEITEKIEVEDAEQSENESVVNNVTENGGGTFLASETSV